MTIYISLDLPNWVPNGLRMNANDSFAEGGYLNVYMPLNTLWLKHTAIKQTYTLLALMCSDSCPEDWRIGS